MLKRRQLIIAAAQSALAFGSARYVTACSEQGDSPGEKWGVPHTPLIEYALGMQAISYIGAICIAKAGFDRTTPDEQLQSALKQKLDIQLSTSGLEGNIQKQLDVLIRKDFVKQRVFEVDGWQLSETECRLAALAASLQGFREVELPEKSQTRIGQIVEIQDWGPRSTVKGEQFNVQPDGYSALWFKAKGTPAFAIIRFAGKRQVTHIYADLFTSGLRGKLAEEVINTPGVYSVELYDRANQLLQPIGRFQVLEPGVPAQDSITYDLDKCSVEAWGPHQVHTGSPFNLQPGGESAFWVKTNCALDGSTLIFDGVPLQTVVEKDLLTAQVPWGHRLMAGKYQLDIKLGNSDRLLQAGLFRVD